MVYVQLLYSTFVACPDGIGWGSIFDIPSIIPSLGLRRDKLRRGVYFEPSLPAQHGSLKIFSPQTCPEQS